MSGKVMRLIDPEKGLMECLVCGARPTGIIKPESDKKFLPESWHCVNNCRLIDDNAKKNTQT